MSTTSQNEIITETVSIPTVTLVIIASQLMGCPVVDEETMLRFIESGDTVQLTVDRKVKENKLIEHSAIQNILNNTAFKGLNIPSNMISAVKSNKLKDIFNNEKIKDKISQSVLNYYIDIDNDNKDIALTVGLANYFGIMSDDHPNDSGYNNTISIKDFIKMTIRSLNTEDSIDISNENINNKYKEYITYMNNSFDNTKADINRNITRAETVFIVVYELFKDEFDDINIYDKNMNNVSLFEALKKPENNVPDVIIKALYIANNKGILKETDGYWDDGVTKLEASSIIISALQRKYN